MFNANSITSLPFVCDAHPHAVEPEGIGRCFWSVAPTGDYQRDYETGRGYAHCAIAYMRANRGIPLLSWVVFDMAKDDETRSGIEAGFLSVFGERV